MDRDSNRNAHPITRRRAATALAIGVLATGTATLLMEILVAPIGLFRRPDGSLAGVLSTVTIAYILGGILYAALISLLLQDWRVGVGPALSAALIAAAFVIGTILSFVSAPLAITLMFAAVLVTPLLFAAPAHSMAARRRIAIGITIAGVLALSVAIALYWQSITYGITTDGWIGVEYYLLQTPVLLYVGVPIIGSLYALVWCLAHQHTTVLPPAITGYFDN